MNPFEKPKSVESKEKGTNVEIVLKFIRHGERTKDGKLTDYGRKVTRERAKESGLGEQDFNAVKAIGSTAGPKSEIGMQRSLETAHIYAEEIAGEDVFETRARDILSYETLVSPAPYDHLVIYNSLLPDNFEELSDEDKARAAKTAQTGVINHLVSLETPEAETYKKEIAGSFACILEHYEELAKRLKPESRVLIPAGTHGGTMEFLLQKALKYKNEAGQEVLGFKDVAEIGGDFNPSEAYNVDIKTNEEGVLQSLVVTFDDPDRKAPVNGHIDQAKLSELAQFYRSLHPEV